MGNILDATEIKQEDSYSGPRTEQKGLHNDSYSSSGESVGCESQIIGHKSERVSGKDSEGNFGTPNGEGNIGKIIRRLITEYSDQKAKKLEEIHRNKEDISSIESKINELDYLLTELEQE